MFVNQFPRNKDLPYSDPIGALGAARGAGKEAGRENGTNPAGGRRRPTLPPKGRDDVRRTPAPARALVTGDGRRRACVSACTRRAVVSQRPFSTPTCMPGPFAASRVAPARCKERRGGQTYAARSCRSYCRGFRVLCCSCSVPASGVKPWRNVPVFSRNSGCV